MDQPFSKFGLFGKWPFSYKAFLDFGYFGTQSFLLLKLNNSHNKSDKSSII